MRHISRRQSLLLSLFLLILFFSVTFFITRKEEIPTLPYDSEITALSVDTPKNDSSTGAKNPNEQPSSQFVLDNFHRSEVKNGEKVWEITATKGRYFPETGQAEVEDAIFLITKEKKPIVLKASAAILTFKDGGLIFAIAKKGVNLVYDNEIDVTTESAIYDREKSRVLTETPVTVKSSVLDIKGQKLEIDLSSQTVRMSGKVHTTIRPQV